MDKILRETLRYMGCPVLKAGSEDIEIAERALAEVKKAASPRYVWKHSAISLTGKDINFTDLNLSVDSSNLAKLFAGGSCAAVFAATLGTETDVLIRKAELKSPSFALAADAAASAYIEEVCDRANEEISAYFAGKGFGSTPRFSPGYGDLDLKHQAEICRSLDTQRRIGLTVSEKGTLLPRKSVTAFVGAVKKDTVAKERDCSGCSLNGKCIYREKENGNG